MATKADIAAYTESALEGYEGDPFVGLFTSPMHAAYCLGEHLRATGRSAPRDVRPGRGDTMHANDMLWRLDWNHSVKHPIIERMQ